MNYYKILGVKKGDSREDIRKAYLKLALQNHPDRHVDNNKYYTDKFQEIGEAYDVLYNKKNINHCEINPYEIFKNLFPKNIDINKDTLNIIIEVYQKIIENNYNFNLSLFFEMIQLINKPNFKKKINDYFNDSLSIKLSNNKADKLIINEEIGLDNQYKSNNYELKINLTKRSKCRFPKLISYYKVFNINLLDEKNLILDLGNYNLKDKYQGDIEINIVDRKHQFFKRYKDFDLIYNLFISKEDFFNEVYHIIPHFKHNINIYMDNPYKNFIYRIKDYGMIDYSDNYSGDLYIYIKVDINKENSKTFFNNYIIPEPVYIF